MKKELLSKLFLSLIFLTPLFLYPNSAMAVESSTSSANFEDKIKLTVEKNLATAEAELKARLNIQNLSGYAGTITSIKETTLIMETEDKQSIQLGIDKNTTFVKSGSEIKFSALAIGDSALAIGISSNDDILNLKRLVIYTPTSSTTTKKIIIATVNSINLKNKSIDISDDQGINYTISLKTNPAIKIESLSEKQKLLSIIKTNSKTDTTILIQAKIL